MKTYHKLNYLIITIIALILLTTGCSGNSANETSAVADTIRIEKTEGIANVTDVEGLSIKASAGMKLYDGYHAVTDMNSYLYLSLDDLKLAKLDENSEVETHKKDKKIELVLLKGSLFFNVKAPLKEDEQMNINAPNMSMGIRGTSGSVQLTNEIMNGTEINSIIMQIYDGNVTVSYTPSDPSGGGDEIPKNITVNAGEEVIIREIITENGVNYEYIKNLVDSFSIPLYIINEIKADEALAKRIDDSNQLSTKEIIAITDSSNEVPIVSQSPSIPLTKIPEMPQPTPTVMPTDVDSKKPFITLQPVITEKPTVTSKPKPTVFPELSPSPAPTKKSNGTESPAPPKKPNSTPSPAPAKEPNGTKSPAPTAEPTRVPSPVPTAEPVRVPSPVPTAEPVCTPSPVPTAEPVCTPSPVPTAEPTSVPSPVPTIEPIVTPDPTPTAKPQKKNITLLLQSDTYKPHGLYVEDNILFFTEHGENSICSIDMDHVSAPAKITNFPASISPWGLVNYNSYFYYLNFPKGEMYFTNINNNLYTTRICHGLGNPEGLASNHDSIFVANGLKNQILRYHDDQFINIGSGETGFKDGNYENASFNNPASLSFEDGQNDILYVLDRNNYALRRIDLKSETITTLLGNKIPNKVIAESASPSAIKLTKEDRWILPKGLAVHQGIFYVSDKDKVVSYQLKEDGTYISKIICEAGSETKFVKKPCVLYIKDDYLYVVDHQNETDFCIYKIDLKD